MNKLIKRTALCAILASCAQLSSAGNVFPLDESKALAEPTSASALISHDPTKNWSLIETQTDNKPSPLSGFALVFAGLVGLGVLRSRLNP